MVGWGVGATIGVVVIFLKIAILALVAYGLWLLVT